LCNFILRPVCYFRQRKRYKRQEYNGERRVLEGEWFLVYSVDLTGFGAVEWKAVFHTFATKVWNWPDK
jgi:hypothetical protein